VHEKQISERRNCLVLAMQYSHSFIRLHKPYSVQFMGKITSFCALFRLEINNVPEKAILRITLSIKY